MLADLLSTRRREVSLASVLDAAPALTRVDRKYFLPLGRARLLVTELDAAWGLMRIGDRSTTHYRSTYFDTADLATARAHVQGRRRRWKARSRLYAEDGLCRIEVKIRDGRGHTVKAMADRPRQAYGHLGHHDREFISRTLEQSSICLDGPLLSPVAEVTYERMTLARTTTSPARLTIDWGVACHLSGERVRLDEEHVLVETKGGLQPGDGDRLLSRLGARPVSFSKYAATAALLRPDIADNDVRRLRGRLLHVDLLDCSPVVRTRFA